MTKTHIATAAAALVAAASFAGTASARQLALAGDYVGTVQGSHSFVAVVLGREGGVRAYLSNGHQLAERFAGAAGDGSLDLASQQGYRLRLQLTYGHVHGTIGFPSGARRSFSADAVAAPGGVYRILVGPADRQTLGGWIVWDSGSALGRVVPSPSTQVAHRAG
jgi:hypothetical protein